MLQVSRIRARRTPRRKGRGGREGEERPGGGGGGSGALGWEAGGSGRGGKEEAATATAGCRRQIGKVWLQSHGDPGSNADSSPLDSQRETLIYNMCHQYI